MDRNPLGNRRVFFVFFFGPMVFHQNEIFQNVEECSWDYGLFSDKKPNFFKLTDGF